MLRSLFWFFSSLGASLVKRCQFKISFEPFQKPLRCFDVEFILVKHKSKKHSELRTWTPNLIQAFMSQENLVPHLNFWRGAGQLFDVYPANRCTELHVHILRIAFVDQRLSLSLSLSPCPLLLPQNFISTPSHLFELGVQSSFYTPGELICEGGELSHFPGPWLQPCQIFAEQWMRRFVRAPGLLFWAKVLLSLWPRPVKSFY